jgi:alpha-L-rhamnosidase
MCETHACLAVPTDCPQRDERMGWTADGQLFARTAVYNMDIASPTTAISDHVRLKVAR